MKNLTVLACLAGLLTIAHAQTDPLPSWNDSPSKQAILEFVRLTTNKTSPKYVKPDDRIATFDQDGTTWVSHPIYTQVVFCLDRVPAVVAKNPELKNVEPFKTVLSGDHEATDGRSETAWLVRDQYEKRLEADLRFRKIN